MGQSPIEELIKKYEDKRTNAIDASEEFRSQKMEISELTSEAMAFAYDSIVKDLKAHREKYKPKEVFNTLKGYNGKYEVSNYGNVKSLAQNEPKILKPALSKSGYLQVALSKNNQQKTYQVHQLVAIAFLNHKPNGHNIVVDHIDNDKTNNTLGNLQLITNRENSSKDRDCNSSRFIGVSWSGYNKKWKAKIYIDGKHKHIGYYDTEIKAHKAYHAELKRYKQQHENK